MHASSAFSFFFPVEQKTIKLYNFEIFLKKFFSQTRTVWNNAVVLPIAVVYDPNKNNGNKISVCSLLVTQTASKMPPDIVDNGPRHYIKHFLNENFYLQTKHNKYLSKKYNTCAL